MSASSRNRIEVMHGVNLDQLGGRDPEHYGSLTLSELEGQIGRYANDLGLRTGYFQSNHEGEFVEQLHRLRERSDGVILNCGAWTHYSWAIRDALEACAVPAVEVHLSDITAREEWRRFSVFDGLVLAQISGKKEKGYLEALQRLKEELGV